MAAERRPVAVGIEAAVGRELPVDDRARQAHPRDVLRPGGMDDGQRRDRDEDEQQQLVPRPPPGKRGRRREPSRDAHARP